MKSTYVLVQFISDGIVEDEHLYEDNEVTFNYLKGLLHQSLQAAHLHISLNLVNEKFVNCSTLSELTEVYSDLTQEEDDYFRIVCLPISVLA